MEKISIFKGQIVIAHFVEIMNVNSLYKIYENFIQFIASRKPKPKSYRQVNISPDADKLQLLPGRERHELQIYRNHRGTSSQIKFSS